MTWEASVLRAILWEFISGSADNRAMQLQKANCFYAFCGYTLKNQLQRQLNISWSTTAHEWIADTDVRRDGDRKKTRSPPGDGIDRRSHVSGEAWQQRIGKVWMIEDVEDFSSQL